MRVRARMTDPAPGSIIPTGSCTLRGKAWSGTGPVTRVELSFTGAGDWYPAELESAKGPYQWQEWTFDWDATDVGSALRRRDSGLTTTPSLASTPSRRVGSSTNGLRTRCLAVV